MLKMETLNPKVIKKNNKFCVLIEGFESEQNADLYVQGITIYQTMLKSVKKDKTLKKFKVK